MTRTFNLSGRQARLVHFVAACSPLAATAPKATNRRRCSLLCGCLVLALCLAGIVAETTSAATFTWNTGVTGSWTVGSNWVGGIAPTPTNTDDVFIDGGSGSSSVVSLNSNGTVNNLHTLVVSSGDRLELTSVAERRMLMNGAGGFFNNAGTITTTAAGSRLIFDAATSNNFNSGLIETAGGEIWLGFSLGAYSIDNTGGIIRAKTGGILDARQSITINGGQFDIQAGSFADHQSQSDGFTLNNVTATNAGTYRAIVPTGVFGERFGILTGSTTFANSGTIDIQNTTTHANNNIDADFRVGSSASLTTTGSSVINIVQNSTTGGTGHNAYLLMNGSGFVNNGALNITSVTGSLGTAQLRATQGIGNAGTITVDGPTSSITMAGQTLTQTAGTLNVKNGGGITAAAVNINGGTLKGNGTITATNTTIAGIHSPGNSAGIQSFVGNLAYSSGATVNWELTSNATATRGTQFDGIDVSGNLNVSGSTGINLVFNSGSSVNWSDAFWSVEHTGTSGWLLYDVAGSTVGFANLSINSTNWLDGSGNSFNSVLPGRSFQLVQSGSDVYLNFTLPAPEPSGMVLMSTGILFVIRRKRTVR